MPVHPPKHDRAAFLPDPLDGQTAPDDGFGEEFIAAATTGESVGEDARDEVSDEEDGGPFLLLGGDDDLEGTDDDDEL